MTLNTDGAPLAGEFLLQADDGMDLNAAQIVSAEPVYVTMDDDNPQTDESGDTVSTNTLWLKSVSPFADGVQSGIVYYSIAR